MLLPQSSLLGGSTRFLVVPNIPNFRPHTHARILTYLGDDPPAYCRQAYSTLSRLGPALPPNNGEANRQLGKRQEALSSSLRSVLRAALLIASLASSLRSCIKLLLLMFLFGWLFLMTTRSILWSGSRHCGWSHNLLLLSVAPCFITILHLTVSTLVTHLKWTNLNFWPGLFYEDSEQTVQWFNILDVTGEKFWRALNYLQIKEKASLTIDKKQSSGPKMSIQNTTANTTIVGLFSDINPN